jgi:hypothetical protein
MKNAVVSTLVVAAIATAGDWVWASFLSRHLMVAGLVHGGLLCLGMGAVLGLPASRAVHGAAAGVVVGVLGAGIFYLLAPMLRMGAMLPAWFALWVMLAIVAARLGRGRQPTTETVLRGVAAGVASGAAFYLVSDMWLRWNPAAVDYAEHFVRWAFAFAPGFVALQAGRGRPV